MKIMLGIAVAVVLAASGAYAKFSAVDNQPPAPQPTVPEIALPAQAESDGGATTSILSAVRSATPAYYVASGTSQTLSVGVTTFASTVILANPDTGTYAVTNGTTVAYISVPSQPQPQLAISCDDDACTVNARDMIQAKALLQRIADQSVTLNIDVAHDANCHPVHDREVIAARHDTKPNLVASR
jgi:hypothetical protein